MKIDAGASEVSYNLNRIPPAMMSAGRTVHLMKHRRDKDGFKSVNDAIALQSAERKYQRIKREHIKLVE